MNKDQFLQLLQEKVQSGEITRDEVTARLSGAPVTEKKSTFNVTKMLYLLGAAIVVIGIIIFVSQIWDDLGAIGRIIITFGMGMILAMFGSILLKQQPSKIIGPVFHAMAGLLIPGGAMVTLSELSNGDTSIWPVAITFGALFIFYLILANIHKHVILTFFAIANGTAFIYLLVEAILTGSAYRHEDLYMYLTMAIGGSYLLLAHSFREGWNKELYRALCFFGITAILGAAITEVSGSGFWQIFYFLLVGMGLYLSVQMKSSAILIMSTLFLLAHISYITGKYFADSVGWPIALVLLGFIFIGLGYSSFTINKKFIK